MLTLSPQRGHYFNKNLDNHHHHGNYPSISGRPSRQPNLSIILLSVMSHRAFSTCTNNELYFNNNAHVNVNVLGGCFWTEYVPHHTWKLTCHSVKIFHIYQLLKTIKFTLCTRQQTPRGQYCLPFWRQIWYYPRSLFLGTYECTVYQ